MKCKQCGINELTTGDWAGICISCQNKNSLHSHILPGWMCPKCGSIYGPNQTECIRCNPPIEFKVTC